MTVSLVRFDGSLDSLRQAIELCHGFDRLGTNDSVLIKPNYCFRHSTIPPYGMVTTSNIMDGVVRLLLERGCSDISIGEGAITGMFDVLEPYAKRGFGGTGIDRVAEKYGVRVIDFNEGPYEKLDLDGVKVQVATACLETDFLINIPVLKTHVQTKVSLGFKNLKGCISVASRKRFHASNRLDTLICLLNEAIETDLTIIDGIYMLEKGPEAIAGVAHRKDLMIASPDVFACDVVGATILGIDPSEVGYLREFAERHGRFPDIGTIETNGEDIQSLKEHLEWRFDLEKEVLAPAGLKGLSVPLPGVTLCSGCSATLGLALALLARENSGMDFGGAELCSGLEARPEKDTQQVFLYGDCAVGSNNGLQNAVRINGCPPSVGRSMLALAKGRSSKSRMIRMALMAAVKLLGIKLGIHREMLPGWERYDSKEFEERHFE